MTAVLETHGLGKRYGRHSALQDCTLRVPAGSVTGLVGLNGAGKTTLLHLAVGLIEPSAGRIEVLGEVPSQSSPHFLARIGFVAQERPLYRHFLVQEMLTLGRKLNPRWDDGLARTALARLNIPLNRSVGTLSGGQQAQIALVLALAKRPEFLLLDEPFANVDPLARREFLKIMLEAAATNEMTILLSSHVIADLDRICDYLVILSTAHVQLADETESLLASHKLLIGPHEHPEAILGNYTVLQASQVGRQSSLLIRTNGPITTDPLWQVQDVSLEEIILAYLGLPGGGVGQNTQNKQEVLQ